MILISWYKKSDWFKAGVSKKKGYSRLRLGKLYLCWMENEKASHMLTKELAPKLIKPSIKGKVK